MRSIQDSKRQINIRESSGHRPSVPGTPGWTNIATRAAIYRSLVQRGPKSQKNLKKGLFWGLAKSLKKIPEKVPKYQFSDLFGYFSYFRLFRVFLRLFSRPSRRLFLRLFCDFGPGGPGDSCKWRLRSQDKQEKRAILPGLRPGVPKAIERIFRSFMCFFVLCLFCSLCMVLWRREKEHAADGPLFLRPLPLELAMAAEGLRIH